MPVVKKFKIIDGLGSPTEANVTEDKGRCGLTFGYDTASDGTLYTMWHFDVIPTSIRTVIKELYRQARLEKFALVPVR